MLLAVVLRRISKPPVSYVYLHSIRSLVRQMKSSGMILNTFTLNLIIKAYARCLEMEEAIQVFREMGLYGCEPNEYSYGYIMQGLLPEGVVGEGNELLQGDEVEGTSAHDDYIHGDDLQPVIGAAARGSGRGGIRHVGELQGT
ncbi:hypothetical protein ZIOFF_018570 [Zingiber officinale]|uniref:Pentatricopeptide repeat-containing protein n=1 Tax=Zingiber officinale TaxID=94328 RepID=A0A8J5HWS4_ZINOF|nr:hypothetical protein ZIOFF_018570 [Zingiber officinale]